MSFLVTLHVLAATIWVGGMFFALLALRPAAAIAVEPDQRPLLWCHTLSRFFLWVWISAITLLVTGYGMIGMVFGGMANVGWHVHLMQLTGIAMMLLFLHVWFAPYRKLKRAVADKDWAAGRQQLESIRKFVGMNLVLGLLTIIIGAGDRYLGSL